MSYKKQITISVIITAVITFLVTCFVFFSDPIVAIYSAIIKDDAQSRGNAKLAYVETLLENGYLGEIDKDKMYDMAAKGMASSTDDPYTVYYTEEEFKSYMDTTTGSYVGVGIILSANPETNKLEVVAPYDNSPGARAGVLPGDIILKVDSKEYDASMLNQAAHNMRGEELENPEGTKVTITLVRNGGEPFDIVLTREKIAIETVSSKMIDSDIGHIRVTKFDSDTDKEFKNHIETLIGQGMKKMILDLRDNPGGDFDVACRFADILLDEGVITYSEDKNGKKYYKNSDSEFLDIPLCVLINQGSASASEVVTGALKDRRRAKIIGSKSYGKGIVQGVYKVPLGGGMSMTIQRYYTPNGICIHDIGIEPDINVEMPDNIKKLSSQYTYEEDIQLQNAVSFLNQ